MDKKGKLKKSKGFQPQRCSIFKTDWSEGVNEFCITAQLWQ